MAVGNSSNQTKEVKGIGEHVESLNDLISLLPLPPFHQSESDDVVDFGEKREESQIAVSPVIDVFGEETNRCIYHIDQINALKSTNETLEEEKRVLSEQLTAIQTEELKKTESIEALEQLVFTLKSRNEFLERPLPGRNDLIRKHQKEVEKLHQKITSQAKENDSVILSLKQQYEKERDDMAKEHATEISELNLGFLVLKQEWINLKNRKDRHDSGTSNISAFEQTVQYDEMKKLIIDQQKNFNRLEVMMTGNKNRILNSLREEVDALRREQTSFVRWLLSRVWREFSDLCWKMRNHFMRQRLLWKIVYVASLYVLIRRMLVKEPERCSRCLRVLMR